jgi:PKD repeat protein
VNTVDVKLGDGSPKARIRRTTASHVYTRIRTYTIRLTVTDRAGNITVITHKIKVKAKPKPKRKHKHGKARKSHAARAPAGTQAQLAINPPGGGGL